MRISYTEILEEMNKSCLSLDFDILTQLPLCGVYHAHDWDHGYESDCGYLGARRTFYRDLREMMLFLMTYITDRGVKEFIVAPFHRINQFDIVDTENDIYREIKKFLLDYGVKSNSKAGVRLSISHGEVLEMIIEGAFRGISNLCILFPEIHVLVAPNHHFGIPFFSSEIDKEKACIHNNLMMFPQLVYYEKY